MRVFKVLLPILIAFPPPAETYADESKPAAVLKEYGGKLYDLAFSPDGKTFAWSGKDRTIRLWDVATHMDRTQLKHKGDVQTLAFSPDSKTLASSCQDGLLRFWDVTSGEEKGSGEVGYGQVPGYQRIMFTGDGKTLVVNTGGGGLCQIWDVATRKKRMNVEPFGEKPSQIVLSIAISPDGKSLAVLAFGQVYLFEGTTGKPRKTYRPAKQETGGQLNFTPDSKQLLSKTDGLVSYDLAKEAERPVLSKQDGPFHFFFQGPDGKLLLLGGDGEAKIWEAATGKLRTAKQLPPAQKRPRAVSPDGRWLVVEVGDYKKGYDLEIWEISLFKESNR